MSVFDETTADSIDHIVQQLADLCDTVPANHKPLGEHGPSFSDLTLPVSCLRSAEQIVEQKSDQARTCDKTALQYRDIITKQKKTIERLREALADIARGPLQCPDFTKYAVQKAKNALKATN